MSPDDRSPGWDKQAINDIAKAQYGGLDAMFEAHGWTRDDKTVGQIAPTRVVQTYGSVDAFVKAHQDGRDLNPLLDPLAAFRCNPPELFLKSFYGYEPETWGFLGYTKESSREKFMRESKPGALVVICGTSSAEEPAERLRVLGMQQQTHVMGTKWEFLAPERHKEEEEDPDRGRRWYHALKTIRAWRIAPEQRPFVRDIFPVTHKGGDNGTVIGSYGMQLQPEEALALLDLDLIEVQVFGGQPVDVVMPVPARRALAPSRPGPVSQSSYMVREAEGPKHLYILRLHGSADHFLGRDAAGAMIVKVGFSVSPATRRDAHNQTLPAGAFAWQLLHSTANAGGKPFPSSKHGLAGEAAMKALLAIQGESLGGEFFLADEKAIGRAWKAATAAAINLTP